MRIYTIGFAGKSAEAFFEKLREAGVQKVVDVRRSNNTLYSGFTRSRDLPFFLRRICGIDYVEEPEFAPSLDLLRQYQGRIKRNRRDPDAWPEYVRRFEAELMSRPVWDRFQDHARGQTSICFLCTEPTAEHCHRRLLAEYIRNLAGGGIEIVHL